MIRLTNSETKNWKRCKRKWYLSQYRGLSKRGVTFDNPLSIGTRMHDAIQHYYTPGLDQSPEECLERFEAQLTADLEAHPTMASDIEREADLCRIMLEGYFQWLEEEGEDSDLRVVEPESEMESPLLRGEDGEVQATILSKVDARVERVSDGKRGALEHKTVGGSFKQVLPMLQVDTQLLTEHLVEFLHLLEQGEEATNNRADFVLYNMLRKVKRTASAKPPFYERHEVRHTLAELRNHWKHTVAVALDIAEARNRLDAGEDHHDICPPTPINRMCTWDCDYAEVCLPGRLDDGQDPEPMLDDFYETVDPLERYRSEVGLTQEVAP
jgi:hypothetical protein